MNAFEFALHAAPVAALILFALIPLGALIHHRNKGDRR